MRNLFTHLLLQVHSNQTNETQSRQNRIESFSRRSRDILESFSSVLPQLRVSLRTFLLASIILMGAGNVLGQTVYSFETGSAWGGSNTSNRSLRAEAARTGSQGLYATGSSGNGRRVTSPAIDVIKDKKYYAICWIKATTACTAGIGIGSAAGSYPFSCSANTWTRIYVDYTCGGNSSKTINPTFTISANTTFYIDDVVFYETTMNAVDLTAPSSATSPSATSSSISWTNGSDAGTGIQNTLIFHRTSGSSDDLTLNNQGVYSLTATEGPSTDQSGHWTLVSASVGAAATSFAGTFSTGDRYAIVHRDLAYNYSTPTYVTVAAATKKIYLKNSMGWATAYVTRLGTSPYWDGTNGSGSYGKTTYVMSYDASMKLFYCDVPANADDTYLCFTKDQQENYGNFFNTEAVYVDGNYEYEKVVWVSTNQTITKNGTKYYNYEDSGIKGINLEDYSTDVYLVGSHNSWTKDAAAKFISVAGILTHTVTLSANTHYTFKIIDNAWFGNNGGVVHSQSDWDFTQWEGNWNVVTGPAGTYTFTYNRTTNKVSITYPESSHPNAAYAYFEKPGGWGACRVYLFDSDDMVMWHGCPMTETTTICGTTYHYAAIVQSDFPNVIFNDNASAQTADWLVAGSGGKHRTNGDADWQDFSTYTIIFNAGGGTGTMSSINGICPNSYQTLPANTFTRTDYVFDGWHANVATKVGGSTIAIGGDIDDEATLQEINNDITLTAQWIACSGPSISATTPSGITDGTHDVGETLGSITVTASAGNGGVLSYQWYQYDDATGKGSAVVAAGTNNAATYNIPNNVACVARHYFCVVSESGCSTTRESAISGALTLEDVGCVVPAALTNEIARFQVPCDVNTSAVYTVTNQAYSTTNTFSTNKFGGSSSNWYTNSTSSLSYGKLTANDAYVQIKLNGGGSFEAGDVVHLYVNRNNATKTGVKIKDQSSGNAVTPASTASDVEAEGTYTIVAGDIEADGSLKFFRAGSSTYINRIIITHTPKAPATVYNFDNGSFVDWGTCSGGSLTLNGSQSGVSYQLYKDGVASGDPKAGTGSSLSWTITASGTYTVKSVANATYAETAMTGSAVVTLQDPTLVGPNSVLPGNTITLTHPGHATSGSWDTSDGSIATVSASGVVTGVSEGTVTITFHGVGPCDATKEIIVGEVEECDELAAVEAATASTFTATVGNFEAGSLLTGSDISLDGYSHAVRLDTYGHVKLFPKTGKTFAAGDSLIVVVYNPSSSSATIGFTMGDDSYEADDVAGHSLYYFRQLLTAANLTIDYATGNVIIEHGEGDGYIVAVTVKRCGYPCTTPFIPSLSNQTLCAGETGTAWNATQTASLGVGETVSYTWHKSGSSTILSTLATYTPTNVTTAMTGTYIVTATVTAAGKLPTSESREVTLTVIPTTATPSISVDPNPAVPGSTATLTATSSIGTTFAWYTCTNASGDGAVSAGSGATLTTATLSVGMYYYKVVATGDGTHSCGTSETVYSLEVAVQPDCYEWSGTPGSFSSNRVVVEDLTLRSDGCSMTSTAMWSGSGSMTAISVGSNDKYIEGFLVGEKEIGSITISACNNQSKGNEYNYAILYCANSSFSSGVTYEEYKTPSKNADKDEEKLVHEFTPPAGTKYFRIYRKVTTAVGEVNDVGDGKTTYIYDVKVCAALICTETTIDVSNATPTYAIGGAAFTRPTFTVKSEGVALVPQPTLTYSSSNPTIATVNATTGEVTFQGVTGSVTITATCERDLVYCASTGSYTITVTCAGEDAPLIVADGSTLDGCGTVIHLWAKQQDGTSSFLDGTYKWYRDGEEIEGATNDYYNVERAGTYTVVRTDNCVQASTNSAVVTSVAEEPTVERLVPFQYYHAGKTYSAQMKDRHLFAVASKGLLAGKPYSMTATSGGSDVLASVAGALWLKPGDIIGSEQTPDTVMLDLNELSSAGFSAGDNIRFVCSAIACGGVSPINDDIVLKVVDATPTMAFICSGTDKEDGTRVKDSLKLNGDFLTGYNKADLCLQTGGKLFNENAELPLYTYLKTRYNITPVNGYAPFKKLNYEPFDILLLTDYPKAKLGGKYTLTPKANEDDEKQRLRTVMATDKLDSMSVLADYRPMLSFKTHMVSKDKMAAGIIPQWAAKGFTTEPTVPNAKPQVAMNIVCFAHPMFNALEIGAGGVFRDRDEPDQVVYEMLSDGGYDGNKGIQGFELGDAGNFMVIAFTHWNAKVGTPSGDEIAWNIDSGDRKLISSCERQVNPEARLLLISINADALCKLTTAGMAVVDSALQYLLITDPNKIADCSLTFNDHHGTGVWSDVLNWAPRYNQVPNADLGARIIKPCTVDNTSAITLSVRMHDDGKLIIPATSALNVISTVRHDEDGVYTPPSVSEIDIKATSTGSGTLILANPDGDTRASVEMYSKAVNSGGTTTWQYITTPFNDVTNAMLNYYESWLYVYNSSTSGWDAIPKGGALTPFAGYCITHPEEGHLYRMSGTLAETGSQGIKVPAGKYMVVGNAWTAPIQIANFDDDDLEDIPVKSIYFFNTGSDPDKTGTLVDDPDASARWAASTYISIPIHSAPFTGDSIISAMQGFYVDNTSGGSEGTLHLQYDKLVRPKNSRQNIVSGPLHAPRRIAAVDDEPTVAKLWVCGSHYDDRLVVLEREDFTRGYDPGWDGEKWEGNAIAPMVYAINGNNGQDAVAAVPDMEGTVVGFKAGEDEEYTFRFNYSSEAEELYLLDTETMLYTRVLTGNTYYFSTNDKAYHNRFILTRTSGSQTPTGCENITGETDNAVKFINNNKMFIFVRGILYDATGKVIKQ